MRGSERLTRRLGALFCVLSSYDCFYMWGPDNHFNSQGDGGYINLSVSYDGNKCQFDKSTSDLYCS